MVDAYAALPAPAGEPRRRGALLPILVYIGLAVSLAWIVVLPLWLGDGIRDPRFRGFAVATMFTPAIAAVVVVLLVERPRHWATALGLVPVRPFGRLVLYLGLGVLVPAALAFGALVVGTAIGVFPGDFSTFSGFRAALDASGADAGGLPVGTLLLLQFANVLIGCLVNAIPALGEEIGWRGWLLPKLLPLGTLPALLVSGAVWGLWHAPLILLGYNYPRGGALGVVLMTASCIVMGLVLSWLRIRSGSVWAAAVGHGTYNSTIGAFVIMFSAEGGRVDTTSSTLLGWSGWILPILLAGVLAATGQFRRRPDAIPEG